MIRGTTPRLTFNLPFETSLVKSAYITVTDNADAVIFEKQLCDCDIDEKCITAALTQEDTLKLPPCCRVNIQLRILTYGKEALASDIYKVFVEDILKDGVIE